MKEWAGGWAVAIVLGSVALASWVLLAMVGNVIAHSAFGIKNEREACGFVVLILLFGAPIFVWRFFRLVIWALRSKAPPASVRFGVVGLYTLVIPILLGGGWTVLCTFGRF